VFETQSKYLEAWQDTVALEMKLYVSNKVFIRNLEGLKYIGLRITHGHL